MAELSTEQIRAAVEAYDAFTNTIVQWVILTAQMQSGKTETYLLIACELLRNKQVEKVIIFSGNAENDLRDQLKSSIHHRSPFWKKYRKYLQSKCIDADDICDLMLDVPNKFDVKWGSELNKFNSDPMNTLFIWEEAHYAQSLGQRPDKFLARIGVSGTGTTPLFEANHNRMLTVSATPFSEIVDYKKLDQNKALVKLYPGNGYVGVKQLHNNGKIVEYKTIDDGLKHALNIDTNGQNWWAIVRVTKQNEEHVKSVIVENGWNCISHDTTVTNTSRTEGECAWNQLNVEKTTPSRNTVILIKGMCRMGKNVEKKHLLFMFETSKTSNTDTILQSLLGRACGYQREVFVYLHEDICKDDIQKYIQSWDGDDNAIPCRAKNLVKPVSEKKNVPIIPIKIEFISDTPFETSARNNRTQFRDMIISNICRLMCDNDNQVVNKNTDNRVHDKITKSPIQDFTIRYISDSKKTYNMDTAIRIADAFNCDKRENFGSGCGTSGNQIVIWSLENCNNVVTGFGYNTFYITTSIERIDTEPVKIPSTTGNEVFSNDRTNGEYTIPLTMDTAYSIEQMKVELCEKIELSNLDISNRPRRITCGESAIIVSQAVLDALSKNGTIYETIKTRFNVILDFGKKRGKTPNKLKENGITRLEYISW